MGKKSKTETRTENKTMKMVAFWYSGETENPTQKNIKPVKKYEPPPAHRLQVGDIA